MQMRNPVLLTDSHPACVTNSFGQPVVLENGQSVAWKQQLLMQLVGTPCASR